ncbi:hypothetical protein [Vibrio vulnificus YJ016]|uniref:Uncharacterized protein n=1 Tax=Vibrio vulnificus (strain YJ016) TaxID=196600 RepID=Q7MPV3_VIBVY|nr:hypothetical protein [Vibrio vulnificus YJ016]
MHEGAERLDENVIQNKAPNLGALSNRYRVRTYSMFWICSLSSGLDPNKLNELSKRNRSKMPVCPPNCPPLAYGFY